MGKVPRNSFWISTGGVYGPLNAVEAIGVTMQAPLGKPTLELRSVRLSEEDPGSDILDRKPVVVEFGQWIPADWPGKVRNTKAKTSVTPRRAAVKAPQAPARQDVRAGPAGRAAYAWVRILNGLVFWSAFNCSSVVSWCLAIKRGGRAGISGIPLAPSHFK